MKIWLDDKRPMPWNFDMHVFTAKEAVDCLVTYNVTHISLDHDLGDKELVGDGYQVAKWIEEKAFLNKIKRFTWALHTQNPVGEANMRAALTKADEYWTKHEQS